MKFPRSSVLVTGGAGFIGSHLCEQLIDSGVRLAIVDSLTDFYSPAVKRANLDGIATHGTFRFFCVDICDRVKLEHVFEETQPQIVVHLAAYAGVQPSIADPCLYEHANIAGTVTLLELCRAYKVPKLVFGSSSSVYGATSKAPFREDQVEMRPISPYAASKLSGELMAYTYAHLFGISVNCLRFFTVFGPRQRPDLAIHKFTKLIESGSPVPVFGDGSAGRDYTYVNDIVSGIVAAMKYEPEVKHGARFEVFNLGNSHPVTLKRLLDDLERTIGRPALRDQRCDQPGDVPLTWADISKARDLLGYEPKTPFETGLANFVNWYRAQNGTKSSSLGNAA